MGREKAIMEPYINILKANTLFWLNRLFPKNYFEFLQGKALAFIPQKTSK